MHIEKQGTSAIGSAIAKEIDAMLTSRTAQGELPKLEPHKFDIQNHSIGPTVPVTFAGTLSVDTTAGSPETVTLNVDCRETAGGGGFFSIETTWAIASLATNGACTIQITQ